MGDVLGRVRYRGDAFIIDRNGQPVARLEPLAGQVCSVSDALAAWTAMGEPDEEFADALEAIEAADRPPDLPWAS